MSTFEFVARRCRCVDRWTTTYQDADPSWPFSAKRFESTLSEERQRVRQLLPRTNPTKDQIWLASPFADAENSSSTTFAR